MHREDIRVYATPPIGEPSPPPVTMADSVSREYLLHHRVCPLGYTADGALRVAIDDDSIGEALDELSIAYNCAVVGETTPGNEIERSIERLATHTERAIELASGVGDEHSLTTDVRDLANQPPVIRYVNLLVRDAYDAGASDIHLESTRAGLAVRFRLDGVLAGASEPPAGLQQAIVSRIKLLAELDIAERRRPQDGRIRVRLEDRELDLRVSTVPTMFGESVVLRLLDRGGRPVSLRELGMPAAVESKVEWLARKPHGMVLVTGPTGSGKTTTLYAALGLRDVAAEKIVTVEDPVEYQLGGITQVPVHRASEVTFASALRSLLRQDPDVVMVGEMRDPETAEIAIQAALTGHLVLSTLHTNDALGAIPRLLDFGVPEYLLAATLEGVLAQRLVRRVCEHCREEHRPGEAALARLAQGATVPGSTVFVHGTGCATCRGTGFRGRVGLFELLVITEEFKAAIARRGSRDELAALARAGGMQTLRTDGWTKIQAGHTTIEEVLRVLQH
jgi:general secretion pathway protein E